MPDSAVDMRALFQGLVYNEAGEPVGVAYIGGEAHYAIPDEGFVRHVEASAVDDAVLTDLQQRIESMKDQVVPAVMEMAGRNDILTKAAIEASIRNLKDSVRQSPESMQWVSWLRLLGFRIIVNVHGQVVEVIYPEASEPGDE